MSRPSGKRKQKFQYSIPMHKVERLPLIREESPNKLYAKQYSVLPYEYGDKNVRFLPEVTSIPPLRPGKPHPPPDVDHTALRWLVDDYMAYTRDSNETYYHLPDVRHSPTCWCCSSRNPEHFTKRNNSYPTSYEKLLVSQREQEQQLSDYERMLLSKRQNPEQITYEEMFLPYRDSIFPYNASKFSTVLDPSDKWARRRWPPGGVRMVPREYLIPEVTSSNAYQDLDDYILRLNHLDNPAPSSNLLDADELYRASMKKLREQLHNFDKN